MSKLTDQQRIDIVNLYQQDKQNCCTIARLYKMHSSSVRQLLINRGIKLKSSSETSRRYDLDQTFFDTIDTEEKAYFLGLLYADGCNHTENNETTISLQEEDVDILEKFRLAVRSSAPIRPNDYNHRKYGRKRIRIFSMCSKRICNRLSELGCVKAKSLVLKFPTSDQVPSHLIRHFVRGYFDGDGCFVSTRIGRKLSSSGYQQWSIGIVSTENFCKGLQAIAESQVGISTYLGKRHKDRDDTNRNFNISGNKQVTKFMDWLYKDATVYLLRKKAKYEAAVNTKL